MRASSKRLSDPEAPSRENSMPASLTMPEVPQDFPDMSNGEVWVWDTWPLTDEDGNQYSVNGQEIIFSLVADRSLGFDERHHYAKIGYFFRPAGIPADERPENGGWTYGGLVFDEGVTGTIFEDQSYSHQTQWSGSARIFKGGEIKLFFTDVAFYRNADGSNIKPYDPRIALSVGKVHANKKGVKFTGFDKVTDLLKADGTYYQTGAQNEFFNFRDPFTFEDPAHPGETYMVFEGNSAMPRESAQCTEEDLGYREGDPHAETVDAGQRLGRDLPDRQHRPREGEERRAHRVGVPAADPLGELRHRPDRAAAVRVPGRQGLPLHHQPPRHVRERHRRPRGRLRLRRQRHPQRLPAPQRRLGPRARQPDEPQLRRRTAVRARLQPAPGPLPGVLALRDARRPGAVLHRHDRHAR